jgi:hypothetical protein
MGRARERGTREERIAQSIDRDRADKAARAAAEQARWDALTTEQQEAEVAERRRRKESRKTMLALTAMVAAAASEEV